MLSTTATSKSYVRSGSSTIEAKGATLKELRELANRTPFDDRGNDQITIDALSPILLYDHLRRVKSRLAQTFQTLPIESIMEQMDLFHGPPERRYIKNVAAMMFCEEPHKFFPYTQVEIVHFPNGAEDSPNDFHEAPTIRGSVPQIIRSTLDYLRTTVVRERIRKLPDMAEAKRYFNYPYQALEEAVVNALYHRDYQLNEPVEITIEPHAISILSHAGPDRSISSEALHAGKRLQTRRYRNRRLGEFFKELSLSEGRATGIPTIQKELAHNGSPKASFETDDDRSYFLISIPCHPDFIGEKIELTKEYTYPIGVDPLPNCHREADATINFPDRSNAPTNDTINRSDNHDDTLNDTINRSDNHDDTLNDTINRSDNHDGIMPPYEKLTERQLALLRMLTSDQASMQAAIAASLGISISTLRRELDYLIDRGIVKRIGSKKTGRWIVVQSESLPNEENG